MSLKACCMYESVFWSIGTDDVDPELLDRSPERELAWNDCSVPGDEV